MLHPRINYNNAESLNRPHSFFRQRTVMYNCVECNMCDKAYVWSHNLNRHVNKKLQQPPKQLTFHQTVDCSSAVFHAPTTISMSGTTGSGKTTLLFKILENRDSLFDITPQKIMYCYGVWQSVLKVKRGRSISTKEVLARK